MTSDPRIATPRAPPISRVVSFIADPTPALPSDTADMIKVVSGVIVRAMPVAKQRIGPYMSQIEVSTPAKEKSVSPTATEPSPVGTIRSTPNRATSLGTWGERLIITKAMGSWNRPDSRAE